VVVERGDRLVYCAGAVADLYVEMGGEVLYAGKPHRPIYERALKAAAGKRGKAAPLARVLAIGDSVRTDLAGAAALGVDCLFVTSGIHAEELGGREDPDLGTLSRLFEAAKLHPRAVTRHLTW
jgi:ribonucleotide monophosphatase NagD (HAD superfamily)